MVDTIKRWWSGAVTVTLFATILFSASSFAATPRLLNFQSLIYDSDGNLTADETVNVTVQIVDLDSELLYEEYYSSVPVVQGAVNLKIGSQAGGNGLPLDIFDPTLGQRFVNVLINDSSPYDLMPLTDVPSALWAHKALTVPDESIESRHIRNGTIKLEDLEEGLSFNIIQGQASESQIPTSFTTDSELQTHTQASPAHSASAISVTSNFQNFVASDVQSAIQKLDMKLSEETVNRRTAVSSTSDSLTGNTTSLQNQIDTEAGTRATNDASLQGQISDEASLRETADIDLQDQITQEISDRQTVETGLQNQIDTNVDVPVGTIIPFYDYNNVLTFDPEHWAYCDGRTVAITGLGSVAVPDLSNRYLVGFGTDGGGDIDTATWDTSVVGIAGHQLNLQHSHTVNGHTHDLSNHTHAGPSHTHTGTSDSGGVDHTHSGPSHSHDVDIASFTSAGGGVDHTHATDISEFSSGAGTAHNHGAGTLKFQTLFYDHGTVAYLYGFESDGTQAPLMSGYVHGGWSDQSQLWGKSQTGTADKYFYTGAGSGESGSETSHAHDVDPPSTTSGSASVYSHSHSIDPANTTTTASGTGTTGGASAYSHTHTFTTVASGTGATGTPSTNVSGSANPGTTDQLSAMQSVQPRSVRVRYLMRIK